MRKVVVYNVVSLDGYHTGRDNDVSVMFPMMGAVFDRYNAELLRSAHPAALVRRRSTDLIICIPVTPQGEVDHSWGRAPRVAVANASAGAIESWEEFDVGWDRLHDEGTEGGHHARIARFLTEHRVEQVVAGHMGPPMQQMLTKMGIAIRLGAEGNARSAVRAARSQREGWPPLPRSPCLSARQRVDINLCVKNGW